MSLHLSKCHIVGNHMPRLIYDYKMFRYILITGVGLSASYTTLLTWLLSLVPQNFGYLQEQSSPDVTSLWMLPFYVIGCQQMLMDDKLYLMVAVTPVEQFDAKSIPTKAKVKKSKVIPIRPIKQNFERKSAIIFLPNQFKHIFCVLKEPSQ